MCTVRSVSESGKCQGLASVPTRSSGSGALRSDRVTLAPRGPPAPVTSPVVVMAALRPPSGGDRRSEQLGRVPPQDAGPLGLLEAHPAHGADVHEWVGQG